MNHRLQSCFLILALMCGLMSSTIAMAADNDGDGVCDDGCDPLEPFDNCTLTPNAGQEDLNVPGDSIGDACDVDEDGSSVDVDDCDDNDSTINPSASEVVGDEIDQTCDGTEICYVDADDDGYRFGTSATVVSADTDCDDSGEALNSYPTTDCDDGDAAISPGAAEVCDGVDNNCDDDIDEGFATTTYYADTDEDGYGDSTASTENCAQPTGYVDDDTDCDDNDATSYPSATEACDSIDNDCNDLVDDGVATSTYYADTDADGFGDSADSVEDCTPPTGYVEDDTDCDDTLDTISPDATEDCDDDADNNCDTAIDCDDATCDADTVCTATGDDDDDDTGDDDDDTTSTSSSSCQITNSNPQPAQNTLWNALVLAGGILTLLGFRYKKRSN